jgi:copper chaperone CopZ
MKKVIKIEGMSCGHCSAAAAKALKALDGVIGAEVNLQAKEAVVEVNETVTNEQLANAVKEAGFEAAEIN